MYDIIIIGGGPAGITASIYGVRAGKKVLVLEAKKVGGKILMAHMVDNYPGMPHVTGEELGKSFLDQALDLGVEIKYEKAMGIIDEGDKKIVQTLDNMYETKTIILATGGDKRELGLPNEKELLGKGVSYCATCDGNFFKNKDVAIVGGGMESLTDVFYLANLCHKVYYIYSKKIEVKEFDNVEVIDNSKIVEIRGTEKLESIVLDKDNRELKVDGLFIEIASVPETGYLLNDLAVDKDGNVLAVYGMSTNKPGIFIAGDIRVKILKQVATAISDGATAAAQAIKYINEKKLK